MGPSSDNHMCTMLSGCLQLFADSLQDQTQLTKKIFVQIAPALPAWRPTSRKPPTRPRPQPSHQPNPSTHEPTSLAVALAPLQSAGNLLWLHPPPLPPGAKLSLGKRNNPPQPTTRLQKIKNIQCSTRHITLAPLEETQVRTNWRASQILLPLLTQLKDDSGSIPEDLIELSHKDNRGVFHIQIRSYIGKTLVLKLSLILVFFLSLKSFGQRTLWIPGPFIYLNKSCVVIAGILTDVDVTNFLTKLWEANMNTYNIRGIMEKHVSEPRWLKRWAGHG